MLKIYNPEKDAQFVFHNNILTINLKNIRDRPFNLQSGVMVFCFSFRIFFPDNARVRIFFFGRAKREFVSRI